MELRGILEFDISSLYGQFQTVDSVLLRLVDDANPIINGDLQSREAVAGNGSINDIELEHIPGDGAVTLADFDSIALSTVGTVLSVEDALDGGLAGIVRDVTPQFQGDFTNGRPHSAFRMVMPGFFDGVANIDLVQFQSQDFNNAGQPKLVVTGTPIPEPASTALLSLGGLVVAVRTRRPRKLGLARCGESSQAKRKTSRCRA